MKQLLFLLFSIVLVSCIPPTPSPIKSRVLLVAPHEFYITISNDDLNEFNEAVNEAIRNGYVPLNGVAMTMSSGAATVRYAQAMVNSKTVIRAYTGHTPITTSDSIK